MEFFIKVGQNLILFDVENNFVLNKSNALNEKKKKNSFDFYFCLCFTSSENTNIFSVNLEYTLKMFIAKIRFIKNNFKGSPI